MIIDYQIMKIKIWGLWAKEWSISKKKKLYTNKWKIRGLEMGKCINLWTELPIKEGEKKKINMKNTKQSKGRDRKDVKKIK